MPYGPLGRVFVVSDSSNHRIPMCDTTISSAQLKPERETPLSPTSANLPTHRLSLDYDFEARPFSPFVPVRSSTSFLTVQCQC